MSPVVKPGVSNDVERALGDPSATARGRGCCGLVDTRAQPRFPRQRLVQLVVILALAVTSFIAAPSRDSAGRWHLHSYFSSGSGRSLRSSFTDAELAAAELDTGMPQREPCPQSSFQVKDAALAAKAEAAVPEVPRDISLNCPLVTGGRRIMELYMRQWDVVNLIHLTPQSSADPGFSAPPATLAQRHALLSAAAEEVQRIALCAAPLSLNQFGFSSDGTPNGCGNNAWFSWAAGCSSSARYDGRSMDDDKDPYWFRLYDPPHKRKTRLFTTPVVADAERVQWISDQHSSDELRPCDVSVYVVPPSIDGLESTLESLHKHAPVQANETMHAVMLFGHVCNRCACVRVCVCAWVGGSGNDGVPSNVSRCRVYPTTAPLTSFYFHG